MKLQKTAIERALAQAPAYTRTEFAIDDHPGLRLRRYPSGQVSWMYRFRAPGTDALRVLVLGQYPDLSPAAADEVWRGHRALRAQGADPHIVKAERIAEEASKATALRDEAALRRLTVRRLARAYLDDVSATKRSWKEDNRILERYVLPQLGDRPASSITAKEVRSVLRRLEKTPVMRDRTLACARAVWNWGIRRSDELGADVVGNPWTVEKIPQRAVRERVLTIAEQRTLMKTLDECDGIARDALALLALTGCRREEVTGARRDEFDLDHGTWRIPGERMKAKRAHEVLLSPSAISLAKRVLSSHSAAWVFPSDRTLGPIGPELPYKWLRAVVLPKVTAPFTLHDIRRTFSTWLGEATDKGGMPIYSDAVIDRVLAHAKRGVVRHYNHARLAEPARRAWQAWAAHLEGLVAENVVELPR